MALLAATPSVGKGFYMFRSLSLVCLIGLLAGCASGPTRIGGPSGATIVGATELPAPTGVDVGYGNRPYYIGPYDKLIIDVYGIEELDKKEVQADGRGRISLPVAGMVEVAGKTPSELEALLTSRLRDKYVRNPDVSVNIKEAVSQQITVDGQVKEPGLYPVVGKMTLMGAVASAKGTSDDAKLEEVLIFRTVNGQKMAALYDLKSIRNGVYLDPEIYAQDVVVVGDSPQRRRMRELLQLLPGLATPIIVLLQNI